MNRYIAFLGLWGIFFSTGLAQHNNHWVFGLKAGLSFDQNPPVPFYSKVAHKSYPNVSAYRTSIVSDKIGNIAFYGATDSTIWNRNGDTVFHDGNLPYTYQQSEFAPYPCNDSLYFRFVFSSSTTYYYILNKYTNNNRGGMSSNFIKLSDSGSSYYSIVKHKNDTFYWLILKPSNYTTHAYLITNQGITNKPVISKCLGSHLNNGSFPRLVISNKGDKVIMSRNENPPNNGQYYGTCLHFMYDFDRATGKFSNERWLIPKTEFSGYYCFSPNDSFLYMSTLKFERFGSKDTFMIHQLPLYSYQPHKERELIYILTTNGQKLHGGVGLNLGPDNRIYFPINMNSMYDVRGMSYIKYPDIQGKGCSFIFDGFKVLPGSSVSTSSLPASIYPIKRIFNHFVAGGPDGCGYDSVRFTADADTSFTHFTWYFGDGDSALGKSVLHTYRQPGEYYVRLACSQGPGTYIQWVGDSVMLKFKPNISIRKSGLYQCNRYRYQTHITYRYADTLRIRLPKGDTLIPVAYSDSPITLLFQGTLDTSGSYIFSAKAWNTACHDSQSFTLPVYFFPPLTSQPKVDWTTHCTPVLQTFSDISGQDSSWVKRKLYIRYPDAQWHEFDTLAPSFSLYFPDTGVYDMAQRVDNIQGCTDSVYISQAFHVFPLPDIQMIPKGNVFICYDDSQSVELISNSSNVHFLWQDGASDPQRYFSQSGSYWAEALSTDGCLSHRQQIILQKADSLHVMIKANSDTLYANTSRPVYTYNWLRNGMVQGNGPWWIPDAPGNWQVQVIDSQQCYAISTPWLYTPIEKNGEHKFEVFPNPAHRFIYIRLVNHIDNHPIDLFNAYGQLVGNYSGSSTEIQIDVSQYSPGLYLVKSGEWRKWVVVNHSYY